MSKAVRQQACEKISAAVNDNPAIKPYLEKIERVCYNDAIKNCIASRDVYPCWGEQDFIEEYLYQINKLCSTITEDDVSSYSSGENIYDATRRIMTSPQKPKAITTAVRNEFKKQILEIFDKNDVKMRKITNEEWVTSLEVTCYQKCVEEAFKERYNSEFEDDCLYRYHITTTTIINNLDPTSSIGSDHLLKQIKDDNTSPYEIVNAPSHMLAPKHSAEIRNYLNRQSQQKIELKTSSYFQCKKCGERRTTYYEKQKRSLDEPATIFINCVNCGANWAI